MKSIFFKFLFLFSLSLVFAYGENGLIGQYYNKTYTTYSVSPIVGTPNATRTDPLVNFNFDTNRPNGINNDRFQVKWTGFILVPTSGNYIFSTYSDDGAKLWINESVILNDWSDHAPRWADSPSVYLTAGYHQIRLEYYENGGGNVIRLAWNGPNIGSRTTVPTTNLFTNNQALSIENISIPEGDSQKILSIPVTLLTAPSQTITLDFSTMDGTAKSVNDYNATNGTLTFNVGGPLTQDINITIFGDLDTEDNEIFYLNFSNPVGIELFDQNISITLKNDDASHCKSAGLTEGFHIVSPDGIPENSFEIYCDFSDPNDIKDILKLPMSQEMLTSEFSNFKFNSSLGSSANYYDDTHAKTYFNYIRINANTLEIIPHNQTGFFDGNFSNINLRGTPFTFDWNNMSASNITGCTLSQMRRDYDSTLSQGGQVLKINPKNENVYQCTGKNLQLKLLNEYKYIIYENKEVLQKTCRKLSEMLPDNNEFDNITGYFYIDPKGIGRDSNQNLSDERPFVAYCMEVEGENPEDQYSWTMFLTLDGIRTENYSDITNAKDTCSKLGLFFFVPNTETTFNKARTFLYNQKAQWSGYTGKMGEYFSDRNIDGWGTSNETNRLYWPYGPMGLYYDDGSTSDGILDPGSAGSWTPITNGVEINNRKYGYDLTSSSEINGTSINIAHINTGTGWKTTLEDMGYPADFWITTFSAGNFYNSAKLCDGTTIGCYLNSRSKEPNGDYTYGNWMHFWADDIGTIYHYNDQGYDGTLNDRYRHDHYMCMAEDNYQFVRRYKTSPGPYNVVSAFSNITTTDPLDEMDEKNALYTQIVNKPFSVKVLRLDDNDLTTLTNSEDSIILELVDGENINEDASTCASAPSLFSDDTTMGISFNNSSTVVSSYSFQKAAKESTFRIKYIDWGKMFLGSGMTCASVSNMSANLKGVPQCLNSTTNIKSLFATKNLDVSLCTDGQNRACDSNMYSANGVNGTIEPETYNHDYGCLACLLDVAASYACSRDKFAIRPDTYSMDANETNLIGGRDYKLDINATQYNNINLLASYYDQGIINSSDFIATITLDKNSSCPLPDDKQNLYLPFSFNPSGRAIDIPFSYDNIGDVNVTLTDKEWTGVDQNENNGKGYNDCILDSDSNVAINGKVGCDINGTKQFVFSPKEFRNTVVLRDFNNTTFTYLSNDINMSAILNINITAILDDNTTATNYTNRCFAKDINTTVSLIREPLASEWLTNDRNATVRIMFFDTNTTNSELNATGSSTLSSIDGNFTNGVANITINFNFDRNTSVPDEPFHIARDDFNITVIDTSDTNGSDFNRTANDYNATFYFGRAYAPDQTFNGDNGNAQVYYEVYCVDCNRTSLNIAGGESVDSINWFQNTLHVNLDGNVTRFESIGNVRFGGANYANADNNSSTVLINQGNEQQLLRINTLPYIDRITYTPHPWLVFNPSNPNATTGDFMVEFTSRGGWGGEGSVDGSDDNNTGIFIHDQNITTNQIQKRMDW